MIVLGLDADAVPQIRGGLGFSRTYKNAVYNAPHLNAFTTIPLNPPQDVLY